jgi:hypothetical protein
MCGPVPGRLFFKVFIPPEFFQNTASFTNLYAAQQNVRGYKNATPEKTMQMR